MDRPPDRCSQIDRRSRVQKRASFSGARHVRSRTVIRRDGRPDTAGLPACSRFSGTPFDQDAVLQKSAASRLDLERTRPAAPAGNRQERHACCSSKSMHEANKPVSSFLAFCFSCLLACFCSVLSLPMRLLSPSLFPFPPTSGRSDCDM